MEVKEHRLSLDHIAEAARVIDPAFLHTPQFVCEPLSASFGCTLTLKVESVNPIRCFKGRGADFFAGRLAARGARPRLVCASAGNFGQAMAFACRKRGLSLTVFAASSASPFKVERMRALGAEVWLAGADFDSAKDAARAYAASAGARFVEDGAETEISEGAGSVAVELLEGGASFDAVLVPLGNGALLNGVARWIKARSPATRVLGVCSRGAAAMAESFERGPSAPVVTHERVETIADGIAVRVPVPEAVADMHGIVDEVLLVTDEALVEAMRLLHGHAGLVIEPAGAAAVAALLGVHAFAGQRVAAILTGSNLTRPQMRRWLDEENEP